jgi:hypothetical protein
MPTNLYTLTDIARRLGLDYRRLRDRTVKPPHVAVVIIGGKEVKLWKLEQFPQEMNRRK